MLTDILPAATRKRVYALYALVGIVLGAIQVAYLNIAGQPQWLTVALAVYGFLGTALGVTAAANTDVAKRDARGRFSKEGGAIGVVEVLIIVLVVVVILVLLGALR